MPVKIEAMQFMDTIADDARLIGSINVFKNENGVLAGFNTDGLGMVRFLQSQSISFYSKVILAGAGGAGQSIAVQLALHGTKSLAIYDKNILAASSLAERISQNIPACTAYAIPFDEQTIIRELQDSALFIDATPLGMPPFENQSPIKSFDGIPKNVIFIDVCYTPPKTPLLQAAVAHGFQVYNGLGMLLHQGVEAFKIWTGQDFPLDYVQNALSKYGISK